MENEKKTISLIGEHFTDFKRAGREIFASSSFQSQSLPLLNILSRYFPEVTILFLDTGYLFAETYKYKDRLVRELNLNVKVLESSISYIHQKNSDGLFEFSLNPDYCCHLNKVLPIEKFLKPGDVWLSGIRRAQTANRYQSEVLEHSESGYIRFHPMLDWTSRDIHDYIKHYSLPRHPLEDEGYASIGCVPCTNKAGLHGGRSGRWGGSSKTECGLHMKKDN
jgi:phosphoadenosine phosphosulfate reductase